MTGTNHLVTGALIAVIVPHPLLAITCALLSHFVIDALPHFGFSYIPERTRDRRPDFLLINIFDATASLTIFLVLPYILRNHRTPIVTMVVMFAAQLPDVVWTYRRWKADRVGRYAPKNALTRFHKWIQWCERPWGGYVELGWFGLIVIAIKLATA